MSFSNDDLVIRFGARTGELSAGTNAAASAVQDAVRRINSELDKMRHSSQTATSGTAAAFNGMAGGVNGPLGSIMNGIGGVRGAFMFLQSTVAVGIFTKAIREVIEISDRYASLEGRLALVTSSSEELRHAQDALYEVAQRSRVAYDSTIDLYTRLARSTKDTLAPSQERLLKVTEAINKALIVSGAESESAKAALIQLGQGMSSAELRGEELNSVLEQTPRLAQMIAEGMGTTVGQLRKLAQEGKLTSAAVFTAMEQQAEKVDKEFAKMPVTVEQATRLVKNSMERVVVEANKAAGATSTLSMAFADLAVSIDTNRDSVVTSIGLIMLAFTELGSIVGSVIGEALGLIVDLANQVGEAFGSGGDVPKDLAFLGNAWQITAGVIMGFGTVVKQSIASVVVVVKQLGNALITLNDIAARTMVLGAAGNPLDAFSAGMKRDANIQTEYREKYALLQQDYERKLGRLFQKPAESDGGGTGGKTGGGTAASGSGKAGKDESRMAMYQERLMAEDERMIREQGHEMGIADEIEFWERILAVQRVSAKDRGRIEGTVSSLRLQQAREELRNRTDLTAAEIDLAEAQMLDELAIEEQKLKDKRDMGEVSSEAYLKQLEKFENQRYEIEQMAQDRRITLARQDPNNPVEVQRQLDSLLKIHRKHTVELSKIQGQQIRESRKEWSGLFDEIGSGMGRALGGFMVGTQDFYQMLNNLFLSIQQAFANMIGKMIADWIAGQMTKLFITQSTQAQETAMQVGSTAASIAAKKAEALAVIPAEAAMAAGAAAYSVAGIPVVGPAMAAAAYGETMALVMSGLAVASAAGGYDIPAGLNPVTQLHQREMVLPARYADVIRGMSNDQRAGASAINVSINAVDSQSVRRLFNQHKTELVRSLRQAARNGSHLK
ncbi:MAG: tape measure protein [Chlorobiaceae bacterium]|nr:tape measure protein [Chlorobiaceae bacterium]